MESEEIKKKIEIELKWGSYYFLLTVILAFAFTVFQYLFLAQNRDTIFILLILNTIILIYITRKCILETAALEKINFLSKGIVFLKLFSINYLLISLISQNNDFFIPPKRELEIIETNNSSKEPKSNFLNDFINFIKKSNNV